MVNIAILGYGTVGSGVVEVLRTNQESIDNKAGEHINLKYVLDLRELNDFESYSSVSEPFSLLQHPLALLSGQDCG